MYVCAFMFMHLYICVCDSWIQSAKWEEDSRGGVEINLDNDTLSIILIMMFYLYLTFAWGTQTRMQNVFHPFKAYLPICSLHLWSMQMTSDAFRGHVPRQMPGRIKKIIIMSCFSDKSPLLIKKKESLEFIYCTLLRIINFGVELVQAENELNHGFNYGAFS